MTTLFWLGSDDRNFFIFQSKVWAAQTISVHYSFLDKAKKLSQKNAVQGHSDWRSDFATIKLTFKNGQ